MVHHKHALPVILTLVRIPYYTCLLLMDPPTINNRLLQLSHVTILCPVYVASLAVMLWRMLLSVTILSVLSIVT